MLCSTLMSCLSLDKRSIAVFRVVLGWVLVGDMLNRMLDLWEHNTYFGVKCVKNCFSLSGVFTEEFYASSPMHTEFIFHKSNRTPDFQFCVIFLQIISGILLSLGFYTKLNSVLSWVLLNSLQVQQPSFR